jgi:hypothetical protein
MVEYASTCFISFFTTPIEAANSAVNPPVNAMIPSTVGSSA